MAGDKGKAVASKSKTKRKLVLQNDEEDAPMVFGAWCQNAEVQQKFDKASKKKVVFDHPVDWNFFKRAWPDVFDLFQCQFWYQFLAPVFPFYKDFVLSIACNSYYCRDDKVWKTVYLGNDYILDGLRFDELVMRDFSESHMDPEQFLPLPGFSPKEMNDCLWYIGWERVYWVLTGKELTLTANQAKSLKSPSYDELTVLAKRVHKFVHLCIIPTTKRDNITAKQAWVVYHIMTKQPISIGSIWLDLVRDVHEGASQVIKNPGWTSWFFQTAGILEVSSHAVRVPNGCCKVDEHLIKSSFTLVDGEWVYSGKKKDGSSSQPHVARDNADTTMGEAGASPTHEQPSFYDQPHSSHRPASPVTTFVPPIPQSQFHTIMGHLDSLSAGLNSFRLDINGRLDTLETQMDDMRVSQGSLHNQMLMNHQETNTRMRAVAERVEDLRGDRPPQPWFTPYPSEWVFYSGDASGTPYSSFPPPPPPPA